MSNKYKIATVYGISHGINDFIAGFLLAKLSVQSENILHISLAYLIYALIAFAGQLPAGLFIDQYKSIKSFSRAALLLMIIAILTSYFNLFTAIIISGIASALIHVCGGVACYLVQDRKSTLAGIFTSPGVVGLIVGGILGTMQFAYFYVFAIILVGIIFWLNRLHLPEYTKEVESSNQQDEIELHDFMMLLMLFAIAFRSLFWDIAHQLLIGNTLYLLCIAMSAFLGKLLGGYLTEQIGWRRFVFITVTASAILLTFGRNYFWMLCVGVALLQSTIPITLVLMQDYLRKSPALAAGLSLGVSIILGGLPMYFQPFREIIHNNYFLLLLSIAFVCSNLWIIRKYKLK
ncbi:MAG: hypothetical protein R2739_05535 [Chitinophagales bacterium]|nr:hypothetical protein [Bacteroidota bacterium]